MSQDFTTQVLIIGSGPAGCTAAIYAVRAGLQTIMVTGLESGGQLTTTTDVENYPGFADIIQGQWLMEQMHKQAKKVGTNIIHQSISHLESCKQPFICYDDEGNKYTAEVIIIATGAQAKCLGLPSEQKFRGYGVSSCATCDGFFYKNKSVLVVGGGNTAVEEALYLTSHAKKVFLVHRRDKLRAENILQKRLSNNTAIEVLWNRVLVEILGSEQPSLCVQGVCLQSTLNEQDILQIPIQGVFIAIGHRPNTEIFKNIVEIDKEGYIITAPNSTKTNVPGIYAAGDVQDKVYRQAVTAAAMGCMAALEAKKFLSD